MKTINSLILVSMMATFHTHQAFTTTTKKFSKPSFLTNLKASSSSPSSSSSSPSSSSSSTKTSFIDTELRGAAMKLHTTAQAPKEGQVQEKPVPPQQRHQPTLDDYIHYLVNQQYIYNLFENDILIRSELSTTLSPFVNTGLERTQALETDIQYLMTTYNLSRPTPGKIGMSYATTLQQIADKGHGGIPELICHYYNHYFAHTAGGRMIGKQLSKALLDGVTLDFYKWDGGLNKIKSKVKDSIESVAETWTQEQKDQCSGATAACFQGGGSLNSYLGGMR